MSTGRGRGGRATGRGRARIKRQEVESEDGWTVITHGISRIKIDDHGRKKETGVAGAMPSQTVTGLTAEKLLAEYRELNEKWEDADVAKQVGELVRGKSGHVSEAVCIGIGSFSRDWEHRWRSLWQLVLFMHVVGQLGMPDNKVHMFAQDPAFTAIDIEFLGLLGVTNIPSGIESRITPRSVVYSPFVDWYILLPTFLKDTDPLLYVGNEILDDYGAYAQTEDKKAKLQECNALGKRFLHGRQSVKLQDFELHAHALNGMRMYWRPSTSASEPTNDNPPA